MRQQRKIQTDPNLPRVEEVDGRLVMFDPAAEGMIAAIDAINRDNGREICQSVFEQNHDRIEHFKGRLVTLKKSPKDFLIIISVVDDKHGGPIADLLMPNARPEWDAIRATGVAPIARGLAERKGIHDIVEMFDPAAASQLDAIDGVAVMVIAGGVAAAYAA